ncbi:carboxyltransferase domain-containing protein [Corynebacterium tapiri]|uniref:Carboxyltransferase domain-containing protein n=1 Tax=Corynebacterium tapiri TaxID=1448266 RepID=A0A5C4U6K8_9CORY|nr:carboxyltransferase domain-containing protein [Corynebacterium tapiri]TNM00532.1 carboxyltransferase domain-containing protein [Corynebacterium tapiri]
MTRIHRAGNRGLLVELPDLATVMRWHAALIADPLPGTVEAVAAAQTILLTFDSAANVEAARQVLDSFAPRETERTQPREVTIDVVYDGEDLDEVAQELGMSREELIDWHTSTEFTGAFGGFAPGFTYCVPSHGDGLEVARRSSPRTAVPSGAVGLAGAFSAVYPRTSPGGWRLIGTALTPMWDSDRQPPALVGPGDVVRYRSVDKRTETETSSASSIVNDPILTIEDAGAQSLIQDLGRAGHGHVGVTESGAADREAHRAANEAVGNWARAATIENVGGMNLRVEKEACLAVTGGGRVLLNNKDASLGTPLVVKAGDVVAIEPAGGLRSYIALRGGVDAPLQLGSRSTDVLSGLGPAPLTAGSQIAAADDIAHTANAVANPSRSCTVLRCIAGPRADWIVGGAEALCSRQWTVTPASNRVGVRLAGRSLERAIHKELPSEGVVAGSIQIPGDGNPVIFLRDHPVTGGYPVAAVVIAEDLDAAAQLRPGDAFRCELIDSDTSGELKL